MIEHSELMSQWLNRLASDEPAELHTDLGRFPELQRVVALPGLETTVQPDSFLTRHGQHLHGEVAVVWRHPVGAEIGTIGLDLDGEEGTISLEDMHLAAAAQQFGLGRAVLIELVDLAERLGLEGVKTMAADVGRYAWARCGFDFFDQMARQDVVTAAGAFADRLGRPFDPGAIEHSWELAELAGEPVSLAAVAAARGEDPRLGDTRSMMFGQALLLGPTDNDWAGLLDVRAGSPSRAKLQRR